ncbi:MAG: hypothetical protein V9E99_08790 [Microthrixaceae bacterium]
MADVNPRSIEQGNQLLLEFPRVAERLGTGGSGTMVWIDGQAVAVGITEGSPMLPELVEAVVVGIGT